MTRVLYDDLPRHAQSKILANKKLSDIVPTADGVVVTCVDGSTYEGSIVVGADGAHSMTREVIRRLSVAAKSPNSNEEKPLLSTYRCLWVRFPKPPELPVGTTCECHGPKATTQLFVGEESGVIGVYEEMDEPTRERIRYTQADQVDLVDRWGHLPVAKGTKTSLTLREIYASRLEAGLVNLEEGVVNDWSWNGRIVLAGDAAHKFTPSTGAGCNNGIIDVIALVNELNAICEQAQTASGSTSSGPAVTDIESAFENYQSQRRPIAISECDGAGRATRSAAWQTGIHKFIDRQIMSRHAVQRFLINRGSKSMAQTPAFSLATDNHFESGTIPWVAAPSRAIASVS